MVAKHVVLGRYPKTQNDLTITEKQRASGTAVLGGTGVGKSTVAIRVALGDIQNGRGLFFIDIDGHSIDTLLPLIPEERMKDVILLDLVELEKQGRYIGVNPVTIPELALQIFKMRWEIHRGTPRLEHTLHDLLMTLSHCKLCISEIPLFLRDAAFRKRCVDSLPSSQVWQNIREYWEEDYNKLPPLVQVERADTILNKVRLLLTIPHMSYAISQDTTTVDFARLKQESKIVLLNVSQLGSLTLEHLVTFLIAELKQSLFSKDEDGDNDAPFFGCFFDEWQLYITPDFADILTRGRKYGIGAMVLNQTLVQLTRELQEITRQLNIRVTFRVGENDAEAVALRHTREPQPETRQEFALTVSPTPVDAVLLRRPHTNKFVVDFFKPWYEMVLQAHSKIVEEIIPGDTSTTTSFRGRVHTYTRPPRIRTNRAEVEAARKSLDTMNGFLYQVMVGKNPFCAVPHSIFQTWCYGIYSNALGEYGSWLTQTIIDQQVRQPTDEQIRAYDALWLAPDEQSLHRAFQVYEQETREHLSSEFQTVLAEFVTAVRTFASDTFTPQDIRNFLDKSRQGCHVDHFIESNWDALKIDASETIYQCQTIPSLPITTTMQAFPRPLYQWACEGASLKPLFEEVIDVLVPFLLERKIQSEIDKKTRSYQNEINKRNSDIQRDEERVDELERKPISLMDIFDGGLLDSLSYSREISQLTDRRRRYLDKEIAQLKRELQMVVPNVENNRQLWQNSLRSALHAVSSRMQQKTWYVYFQDPSYPYTILEPPIDFSPVAVRKTIINKIITSFFEVLDSYFRERMREFSFSTEDTQKIRLILEQRLQALTLQGYAKYWVIQTKKTEADWQTSLTIPSWKDDKADERYNTSFQLQITPAWLQALQTRLQAKIDQIVTEQKEAFEQAIRVIRQLLAILVKEPISELSNVLVEKSVTQRSSSDMKTETAIKLAALENYAAYVAIGSEGDRFKHLIKMQKIPQAAPELLTKRKDQALQNAYPYTTTIADIEQQGVKRRHRFGIASFPVAQFPQMEQENQLLIPTSHASRRTKLPIMPSSRVQAAREETEDQQHVPVSHATRRAKLRIVPSPNVQAAPEEKEHEMPLPEHHATRRTKQ